MGRRHFPDATAGTSAVDDYYQDAIGKTGPELTAALHGITSIGTTTLSYDQAWDALKVTDEAPNNNANVILLYTGRPQGKYTNAATPTTGTARTSGPNPAVTSAPRPALAPTHRKGAQQVARVPAGSGPWRR